MILSEFVAAAFNFYRTLPLEAYTLELLLPIALQSQLPFDDSHLAELNRVLKHSKSPDNRDELILTWPKVKA